MAILKTKEGLIQLHKCPVCGFFVVWQDMNFENDNSVGCVFCPTLRATDAEDSAPSQAVSNADNLSNSDGFAVPARRS